MSPPNKPTLKRGGPPGPHAVSPATGRGEWSPRAGGTVHGPPGGRRPRSPAGDGGARPLGPGGAAARSRHAPVPSASGWDRRPAAPRRRAVDWQDAPRPRRVSHLAPPRRVPGPLGAAPGCRPAQIRPAHTSGGQPRWGPARARSSAGLQQAGGRGPGPPAPVHSRGRRGRGAPTRLGERAGDRGIAPARPRARHAPRAGARPHHGPPPPGARRP